MFMLRLFGAEFLRGNVDTLVVIPNEKLLEILDRRISFKEGFKWRNNNRRRKTEFQAYFRFEQKAWGSDRYKDYSC